MTEEVLKQWDKKIGHDFQGCPSRCAFCEFPLLEGTEEEECETRTIALFRKAYRVMDQALTECSTFIRYHDNDNGDFTMLIIQARAQAEKILKGEG